ncbi:MAG: hypothetical protein NWF01_08595 [Candidatus Bathyarchaeota archaeon]|nr:hypothetical protein [Candidatus Bathyarchaeota archaeon]
MAYLREEKETYEIDYPVEQVWTNIPKVTRKLQWQIIEIDNQNHKAKVKTKGAFLSYGSTFHIEAKAVNEKTTRMSITAETPVTTITSVADFGRTRDRVEQFIAELAYRMNKK